MLTNPPDLPSTVDATLEVCPRFRILVVGNTGVGKSSLVSSVFNVDIKDTDVSHDRVGQANIAREYKSEFNPRFILHDSKGFEPGSLETWDVVETFIREKCDERLPSKDRLHAIWLCIETPRTGARLLQTADEKLLALASNLQVAVIIVFTKYDLLFNEYHRKAVRSLGKQADPDAIKNEAGRNAQHHLATLVSSLQHGSEFVTVSTEPRYPKRYDLLKELSETTRRCLHEVEGDLWVPWAAAQQISAQQKVNFSINEGFKEYWVNLGKSTVFQGHSLLDCVSRIHKDIIAVWNFYDPEKLLSGTFLSDKMVKLIDPLSKEPEAPSNLSETLSSLSNLTSIAGVGAASIAPMLSGVGIAVVAGKFLYQKYRAIPLTALCLGAYIVDLTLILYRIFEFTVLMDPPRSLKEDLIVDVFKHYKDFDSAAVHQLIRGIVYGTLNLDPKDKIADLIRQQLNMDGE